MATENEIIDSTSFRSRAAAVAAEPGSIAIQNVGNVLKSVDDQGVATTLGGGGGAIVVTAATGLTGDGSGGTPLAGVPASASVNGYETAAQFTKLANLPGPWTTIAVPGDVQDVVLSLALDGDNDGGYEILVDCVAVAGTENYYLRVGVDGGGPADAGCDSIQVLGNGAAAASISSAGFLYFTDANVGQTPHLHCSLESLSGRLRYFQSLSARGPAAAGGMYIGTGQFTSAGNITGLTLHGTSADSFKAGSLVKWRKLNGG
jgi:hypothetical protein